MRNHANHILKNDPQWYKDAIIYQLHVKAFYDSNNDGIGDFQGLKEKLGYLQELGITAIWLLPFYPSPLKDDGYDISDFKDVHPSYGKLRDFKAFLREAHSRGLRVITELVINHTSDQHPWFQRARKAKPDSNWRNFYVWSDTAGKYAEARIIFQDFETSNWTWDTEAKAYYWHRFYSHQPDLNYDNPKVHEAVFDTLDFWMDMGVDGMRLDAIPYLYQREGTNCENLPETHEFLKKLRARIDEKYQDRMFLAEANQWPEDAAKYFGNGDECQMCFNFPLMPRLYMALHMENRYPVTEILNQTPAIPDSCQWAIFLRNHDELTLEMVTDEERDYMIRAYAMDSRMRINLGIRRRLSPLLGNHRRRIELLKALLLSLPGTPVLYYGDEIGMGDNIYLGDRNGVRTPMQWSADRNAGFSRANPQMLYLPVIIDQEYHFDVINVESQLKNRHSLFWWMRRMITLRNRFKAFSRGDIRFLEPDNPRIFAFTRTYLKQIILIIVNFSRFVQYAELDLSAYEGAIPIEIFGNTVFPKIRSTPYFFTLSPHSFYWFGLVLPEETVENESDSDALPVFEFETKWEELFGEGVSDQMVKRISAYIKAQRWFGSKSRRMKNALIREIIPLGNKTFSALILFFDIEYTEESGETYILPIVFASDENAAALLKKYPGCAVCRVKSRSDSVEGFLVDALVHQEFCTELMEMIAKRHGVKGNFGRLAAAHTNSFHALYNPSDMTYETSILKAEQSNTSVVYGNHLILKILRRLQDGVNPELEMSRFLTRKGFRNMPLLSGAIEYVRGSSEPKTIAILQAYIPNQGDAWKYTLNTLSDYFDKVKVYPDDAVPKLPQGSLLKLSSEGIPKEAAERIGVYIESVRLLAICTAQMHNALSSESEDRSFTPEPFSKLYQRSIFQSMSSLAARILPQFRKQLKVLPETARIAGERIVERQQEIFDRFRLLSEHKISGKRLRCHGDYHLGQVLYTGRDFVIIDFEGEPARPVSERRIKRSPVRDVAGMLRSFHYAAYSALMNEEARGSFHPEKHRIMERYADEWYVWVCAEFLRSYLANCIEGYLPATLVEIQILLDALLMEKAIYELGYEMNNRPDWIKIPLKGIEYLLSIR